MALSNGNGSYTFEQQLAQSDERLHLFIDSVVDYAIFMLDPEGNIISWNPGAERIKGYKPEEIIGKHFSIFYTEEDNRKGHWREELKIAREVGRYEEEGWRVRKDGSMFFASVVITAIHNQEGELTGFGKVTRDMTERRALVDSEERFRLLVESVTDYAIFMLDEHGKVASWNTGAERIKGYTADEILGKHFSVFYTAEDRVTEKPRIELETAINEGKYEEEGLRVRKDGTAFWANVILTPVRDASGTLKGFAKVTRDITLRREMEDQLRELNRQLEAFAYSVAHDLRTPLRTIVFTSRIILDEAGDALPPDLRDLLSTQVGSSMKLARVVEDLLQLSRLSRQELQKEPIDLTDLAHQVMSQVVTKDWGHVCTVEIQEGLTATGDETLVRVLLQNLFENACKFSPNGGKISLTQEMINGKRTFLVRDQGVGFDMDYKDKIFLPFERLVSDTEFEGTGIGLANVQRAVMRHGGRIWVDSEPGKGTTFFFTLE